MSQGVAGLKTGRTQPWRPHLRRAHHIWSILLTFTPVTFSHSLSTCTDLFNKFLPYFMFFYNYSCDPQEYLTNACVIEESLYPLKH